MKRAEPPLYPLRRTVSVFDLRDDDFEHISDLLRRIDEARKRRDDRFRRESDQFLREQAEPEKRREARR